MIYPRRRFYWIKREFTSGPLSLSRGKIETMASMKAAKSPKTDMYKRD